MAQDQNEQHKQNYIAQLARLIQQNIPQAAARVRSAGAERFQETPLPHTRMEEFRQTNLAPVTGKAYTPLTEPTAHGVAKDSLALYDYGQGAWPTLVFVDGYFAKDLSSLAGLPAGVVAGSLWDALFGPAAPVAEKHLGLYLQPERNAFAHLNSAFLQDGPFVYIPKNAAPETPIQVIHVTSPARAADTVANPRFLFVLDTGAEATILESFVAPGVETAYFNNVVSEIALEPNAKLSHYKMIEEGAAGHHLATTEVHQDRDTHYRSFVFTVGGAVSRNQLCIALDGENGECSLHGLYLNSDERLIDNALNITHIKPHCNSRIAYKGVLDGKSSAVFLGKVYVHPEAQKTDSDQLSQNMLLSDGATIDTKPQLEIYADDVKCTHGATIGSPPEPVIFYFRSRGIDEATARAMLTYGFADEVVNEVEIEPLRARLESTVYDLYSPN